MTEGTGPRWTCHALSTDEAGAIEAVKAEAASRGVRLRFVGPVRLRDGSDRQLEWEVAAEIVPS